VTDSAEVLEAWFGNDTNTNRAIGNKSALWWGKDPDADAELRRRFGEAVEALLAVDEIALPATPEETLARIILADQITRSIYRDTPRAFAGDGLALGLCLGGLAERQDLPLNPLQRVFFYLPLEHAESLEHQERAVHLFETLLETVEPELRQPFENFLDFARRHRDVIARFGRFPHRNRILGRESTPEEEAFLKEPGSGF
jgi:uncharacterized protein (DUF924 family)